MIGNFINTERFVLFRVQSKPGSATRYGVTRKARTQRWKAYRKANSSETKGKMYLSILDINPFSSKVKGNYSAGKEIRSLVVQQDKTA